jgi:hypothetical protein
VADGVLKNFQVVGEELKHWVFVMKKEHLPRFKEATLRFDGKHRKNNIVHLLFNLLTETVRALPRTISYCLCFWGAIELIPMVPLW